MLHRVHAGNPACLETTVTYFTTAVVSYRILEAFLLLWCGFVAGGGISCLQSGSAWLHHDHIDRVHGISLDYNFAANAVNHSDYSPNVVCANYETQVYSIPYL